MTEHLVVFQPSGKRGRFEAGTPVLDAARSLGVPIESVCGGRGICGKCQVSVAEGAFAKFGIKSAAGHLSASGFIEKRYDEKRGLEVGRRLSCTATVQGDVVVEVPEAFRVATQTIRKAANTTGMVRNPAVRLAYVEVPQPDMDSPEGDADRLCAQIEKDFGFAAPRLAFHLLPGLQKLLRKADWKVTAVVRPGELSSEIVALFADYAEDLTGIAVDIGSTTIAAHLVDMLTGEILVSDGEANPQIRFGEDLMSRVSYVMMNEGGQDRLTAAVREAVNRLIDGLLEKSGRAREGLLDAVFVANPVMHHLFFGFDPTELGQAPFAAVQSAALDCRAEEIGLTLPPGAWVHALPLIAGHVGADAAAVALAQHPWAEDHPVLIVDVGTNAEILLWDGKQMFAASSPTGPAFEGAEISCGQRAAPGAIERIRIDKETLAPKFRVIGTQFWSDAPEFPGAVAATGITGVCGSAIIEVIGEMLRAGILSPDGIIRGPANEAEAERLVARGRTHSWVIRDTEPRLEITQNDVRAIQLAKAALYAGVRLLMDRAGLDGVGDIRLAGAFGTFIDPEYALLLGLVPDARPSGVRAVGNAAGQGALIALLDRDARAEITRRVGAIEKVETALEPAFQEHFVSAMAIPNAVAPFPVTRAHFGLPAHQPPSATPTRRRRRHSS